MSVKYKYVGWNRQKKIYDGTMAAILAVFLLVFFALSKAANPWLALESILIRGTAFAAIVLLHVILIIGPLCRLDARFLPLLYNRRHLGVTMFLLALTHGAFTIVQYHGYSAVNPFTHPFAAYAADAWPIRSLRDLAHLPFEPFGAFALIILFLMAATSHDFWLRNLGGVWKLLHVMVYPAYGAVLVHVAYGFLQDERSPAYPIAFGAGFALVAGFHLLAYRKEARIDAAVAQALEDGFQRACAIAELREARGKPVRIGNERVAVFRHHGRVFALSNVCRHQGGPIGEGRILDGCITCPWHGWQYRPEDGVSPPPFKEVIATYRVKIIDGAVYVHPNANALETACPGAEIGASGHE